jgi:hypothetical protein
MICQFATDMNCHVQIVTHPAKMERHRRGTGRCSRTLLAS